MVVSFCNDCYNINTYIYLTYVIVSPSVSCTLEGRLKQSEETDRNRADVYLPGFFFSSLTTYAPV